MKNRPRVVLGVVGVLLLLTLLWTTGGAIVRQGGGTAPSRIQQTRASLSASLDQLDPRAILPSERLRGDPRELVAIFGKEGNGRVRSLTFSPDGTILAGGGDDRLVRLWDTATGTERAVLAGPETAVVGLAFSADGKTLITGGGHPRLWDVASAKELAVLKSQPTPTMCLALSPDGKTVAAGHGGGLVRLWDVASAKERDTCKGLGHLVFSLAYSPDGQTLAVSSYQQSVALLHPSNAARQGSIDVGNVYSLAYSPDGRTLALACDRVVKFWDVGTARERSALAVSDARCLAFAPDGKKLVTSSSWGNATVWGLPSGEKLHHWPFPHTASMQYHCSYVPVFAPDSRHLAVAGDTGKVYVFRLAPPATGRTE